MLLEQISVATKEEFGGTAVGGREKVKRDSDGAVVKKRSHHWGLAWFCKVAELAGRFFYGWHDRAQHG
eukprot:1261612-Pleurochrysis_carterae.AAC.1